MLSHGLPLITLPTRISEYSATLTDNIFSNGSSPQSQSAGILLSNISDHFPYFCFLHDNFKYCRTNKKYIYYRNINNTTLEQLYHHIENKDLRSLLKKDVKNPNINYNILHDVILNSLNICIPLKKKEVP